MVLTVAGREISDPLQSWHDYAARTRTLAGYDLAGAGYPGRLTKDEIWRTRILSSRISHAECARLLERATTAPWQRVPANSDLADADPVQRDGLFDSAAALYWHFIIPRERGLGPAKIHKMLHVKRPALYPVLDSRIRRLYAAQARTWVSRLPEARSGDSVTFWAAIRDDLVDAGNQAALRQYREDLRAGGHTARLAGLPNLRLFDIIAWQTAQRESM